MKVSMRMLLILLLCQNSILTVAQNLYSGLQALDEAARKSQIDRETDSLISYTIRPLNNAPLFKFNNYFRESQNDSIQSASVKIVLLPLVLKQQYNTHHPYGWNDGSMISAKGYQNQLLLGIFVAKSIMSLQIRPELVYASNPPFSTFPSVHRDSIWNNYYYFLNKIDNPFRFGSKSYIKLFPGQSSFRFNYKTLSLGVSTENLWWGPGIRNSLLMSNNAPGFPHLSFNSRQPVTSSIGSFEWQLISGRLQGSNILPEDTSRIFNGQQLYVPKGDDDRYLNGLIFTWQPKWTKGLFVGFSRVFYQYVSDVPNTLNGYLPVLGKFFKQELSDEDQRKRDQMISVFFRLLLAKEKAEIYGEFGRNDHSLNLRDFLVEPEHSRGYIFGFSKSFQGRKKDVELFGEMTNLQMPSTIRLRAQETWYTHYQVRHGYTNKGQVIGAGIGPGGASQTLGLQWGSGLNRSGATIERVVHNNDFYYQAFEPLEQWQRHWVDLSLNLNKSWRSKRIIYDLRLSNIVSLNYQWYKKDVFQISAKAGVAYLF